MKKPLKNHNETTENKKQSLYNKLLLYYKQLPKDRYIPSPEKIRSLIEAYEKKCKVKLAQLV